MTAYQELQELCKALGLLDGSPEKMESLQAAARWALAEDEFALQTYQPTALKPILATITGHPTDFYIPAMPLTLDKGKLMPRQAEPSAEDLTQQLKELKKALAGAATEAQLLSALEVHGSTLAVSEKYQDLSLVAFCKITVGIAKCLEQSDRLRLIGGSISGIQTYLYDIISKNAAKLLKGRSFYLQLLADSLLDELRNNFDLSVCQVIYASGGGFFVMIPDTKNVEAEFEKFLSNASEQVYDMHGTNLFAELAISDAFDQSTAIDEVWSALYDQLDELKFKRLNQNQSILDDFFSDAVEVGGITERDRITNEEITNASDRKSLDPELGVNDPNNEDIVHWFTKQQIDLGRDLAKAAYWYTSQADLKKIETIKDPFGKLHWLLPNLPENGNGQSYYTKLNEISIDEPFTLYGGNKFPTFTDQDIVEIRETLKENQRVPHRAGDIKTYEYLVNKDGLKRLGILRMDVDSLGGIFSHEIKNVPDGAYQLNLTRYATASRSLDYFFKGYLNELQKDRKETIVIIYSGGDDLFIVGRWKDVLDLAQEIHNEFARWTCGLLTLSGGMEIVPSKFPVMQGARLAEAAEKKAKAHKLPDGTEKNAICLFGVPMHWEQEFRIVRSLYEDLLSLFRDHKLNRSFLSKINAHAAAERVYEEAKKNGKPISPKWRWVMTYDISRFTEGIKNQQVKTLVNNIAQGIFLNMHDGKRLESKYTLLMLLQIAARWVELELRTENREDL